MTKAVLVTVAIAIATVGCGRAEEPASVPPDAVDASGPVLVSLADLRASVPHLDGWTRGNIVAESATAPDPSTHAVVTFTSASGALELEIADTGGAERVFESLEHMAGSEVNRVVDNGYFKGTTILGFPAVESWNTVDKLGELSVLIKRRYIIHVTGTGLADAAPMRALAEAVDTSRLR
ncbi:MAG: hypothetical protein HQ485_15285 [Acidobacteria bacterium]|jgi:hypothetical protein|nr:hypothetical protein [Acidobacteriota bacterium]